MLEYRMELRLTRKSDDNLTSASHAWEAVVVASDGETVIQAFGVTARTALFDLKNKVQGILKTIEQFETLGGK